MAVFSTPLATTEQRAADQAFWAGEGSRWRVLWRRFAGKDECPQTWCSDLDISPPQNFDDRRLERSWRRGSHCSKDFRLHISTRRRRADITDGAVLGEARKDKVFTYPELCGGNGRALLVAGEVGGRWSDETKSFLWCLASAKAAAVTGRLFGRVATAFGQTEFGHDHIWPTLFDRIWPNCVGGSGGGVGQRCGPQGWGPEGWWGKRRVGAQISRFFSLTRHNVLSSLSWVSSCGIFKRRGSEMCTSGVLGLSCEALAVAKPPGVHTTKGKKEGGKLENKENNREKKEKTKKEGEKRVEKRKKQKGKKKSKKRKEKSEKRKKKRKEGREKRKGGKRGREGKRVREGKGEGGGGRR